MKLNSSKILFLLFLLPLQLLSQKPDITGVWKGELVFKDTIVVHLPYEIAVSEEKNKLTGYSRITFHANGRDEFGMQNITIEWKGDDIIMEDEGFIEHGFSVNPSGKVKKTMIMQLVVSDSEMVMTGTWSTNRTRRFNKAAEGTSVLKRRADFKSSPLFKRLDTLKLAQKLSFKDRPETTFIAKVTPPPVEIKPLPVNIPVQEPDAEPEILIPEKIAADFNLRAIEKKKQPAVAKIARPSAQKKAQMDALAKTVIKPPVIIKPAPEPVVTASVSPKPEKETAVVSKPEPVAKKVQPAPAEKKPAEVVSKPVPKPVPPPLVVVPPSVTQGAAEIEKRVTKADQSFYFESDSLVLTLYDNGEVDGDTVTVLMNGGIIFSKAGLTTKPNTKTVYITSNMDSVKLVMYAESLGEIPPNTGLLIVNDGDKRYDVRFSADLKTNAGIVLRRRKNE